MTRARIVNQSPTLLSSSSSPMTPSDGNDSDQEKIDSDHQHHPSPSIQKRNRSRVVLRSNSSSPLTVKDIVENIESKNHPSPTSSPSNDEESKSSPITLKPILKKQPSILIRSGTKDGSGSRRIVPRKSPIIIKNETSTQSIENDQELKNDDLNHDVHQEIKNDEKTIVDQEMSIHDVEMYSDTDDHHHHHHVTKTNVPEQIQIMDHHDQSVPTVTTITNEEEIINHDQDVNVEIPSSNLNQFDSKFTIMKESCPSPIIQDDDSDLLSNVVEIVQDDLNTSEHVTGIGTITNHNKKITEQELEVLEKFVKTSKHEEMIFKFQIKSSSVRTSHPLLDKLHSNLSLLAQASSEHLVVTRKTAFCQNVVKLLDVVLTNRTRAKFYWGWKERDLFDVFSNFKQYYVQQTLIYFDSFDFVKKDGYQPASMVLLQFLLESNDLIPFVNLLLESRLYIDDVYEPDSIMSSQIHHQDLICVLERLKQFTFCFGYIPSISMMTSPARVLNDFKMLCKGAVKAHLDVKKGDLASIGNFVNVELLPGLELLLSHGIKLKNVVMGVHEPWDVLEATAKRHSSEEVGLSLSNLMYFIDSETKIPDSQKAYSKRIKLSVFFVHCLNKKLLSQFLSLVFSDDFVIRDYYSVLSVFHDREKTEKIIVYAATLTKLPFCLG
ncbi:infB [Acrasis kona]|uniref:InfB n=1 Tax=Acrasis kona TaxID=1008807 RepID=A0AAW2ZIZ1_9EUKA